MGLFSFGGSKSKSRSEGSSQSSSFGEQDSLAFDRGTSSSVSGGTSRAGSEQFSRGTTRQSIAFDDVFARLFGNAEQVAANLDPSLLTQAANELYGSGTQFLSGIGGDVGSQFLEDRLGESNPYLEEQISLLGEDIGRFLEDEINPVITGEAIQAGALGGGRQGVAQGEASRAALEEFTRGASNLRYQDVAARDALAGDVASRDLAGRQLGLGSLGEMLSIAQGGFGAELMPAQMLAQIMGGPTVLSQSDTIGGGSSFSTAEDFARAFSESFGGSASRGRSGSQSTSNTRSKSDSFGLNLKFI